MNDFRKKISQFFGKLARKFRSRAKQDSKHYISNRESKAISRENFRLTREYEKRKHRRGLDESEYVTEMRDPRNVVEFENLHTYFFTDAGTSKAVNGVTFDIPQGSIVGVVGESGCGKSVTSLSLMQLVQAPQGQIVEGSIRFRSTKLTPVGREPLMRPETDGEGKPVLREDGQPVMRAVLDKRGRPRTRVSYREEERVVDIARMPVSEMGNIRGREISMIFQEPMTSLNPVFTVGYQLDEVPLLHIPGITGEEAKRKSLQMLDLVGIANAERIYKSYPHELSGGMRQRVMIAMALACKPKLIIADEPTTALDVTIQAQILDLLREVKDRISGSILLITHDLGVIAEMADSVVVMYAGRIVEKGTVKEIFDRPLHPYTVGLQKSKPVVNKTVDRLFSIPGQVPNPINMPDYCYFRDRCDRCIGRCGGEYPPLIQVTPTHSVACYLYREDANSEKKDD